MPKTSLFETLRSSRITRRLRKGVLRYQPSWGCVSGYFYLPDTNHFAVGFVADYRPSGGVLLQFTLPLYVEEFEGHLTFADPLPGADSEFDTEGKSADEMGQEFVSKADPYIENVRQRDSLPGFAEFIESQGALGNDRVQFVYGLTLLMLERPQEAVVHLQAVAASDWARRVVPNEARAAASFVRDIESGSGAALSTLHQWTDHNRVKLGLSSAE